MYNHNLNVVDLPNKVLLF